MIRITRTSHGFNIYGSQTTQSVSTELPEILATSRKVMLNAIKTVIIF